MSSFYCAAAGTVKAVFLFILVGCQNTYAGDFRKASENLAQLKTGIASFALAAQTSARCAARRGLGSARGQPQAPPGARSRLTLPRHVVASRDSRGAGGRAVGGAVAVSLTRPNRRRRANRATVRRADAGSRVGRPPNGPAGGAMGNSGWQARFRLGRVHSLWAVNQRTRNSVRHNWPTRS
jgi:hypothetical protein